MRDDVWIHDSDDYCDVCGMYFGNTGRTHDTEQHGTICAECFDDLYPVDYFEDEPPAQEKKEP